MAKAKILAAPGLWEDRWSEPTADQLIDNIIADRRSYIVELRRYLHELERYEEHVIWGGPGWNWTLAYRLPGAGDTAADTFAYIVPRPEEPVFSVPFTDRVMDRLPIRRLNRTVRENLRSAKKGISLNWATWTPNMNTEVEHLKDLLKRKNKLLIEFEG